jgi:hypothetical protein
MALKIISADERLAEQRGAKLLIVGPTGVGKTSLLKTLKTSSTLFVDIEAGDLAVIDLPVPTIRLSDWPSARDLVCRIGGPNTSYPPNASYSEAHYRAVGGALPDLDKYETVFVDSLTALSRLAFRWAEQQPEATSERTGRKDIRSAYGLLGREMINFLNQLQHARSKNIVFVAILEKIVDEFNHSSWEIQMEGGRTKRELPGIVDGIVAYQFLDFGDGKPIRAFVCTTPNNWGFPAKDRSGRLETIERPDLGQLLLKSTTTVTPEKEEKADVKSEPANVVNLKSVTPSTPQGA